MIRNVYSLRDDLIGFTNIVIDQNHASAKRNFIYSMNVLKNERGFEALRDYSLYFIGTFDDELGRLESSAVPDLICRATSVVSGGDVIEE